MLPELLREGLEIGGLLGVAAVAGYGIERGLAVRRRPLPKLGATIRLRSPHGVGRARLISTAPHGWQISPLIFREGSREPSVGDTIVVEAPCDGGVVLFRAKVKHIDEDGLRIRPPRGLRRHERRQERRLAQLRDRTVLLDGKAAQLLDMSAGGARLRGERVPQIGMRTHLEIDGTAHAAWIIGAEDGAVRVRFEEPLTRESLTSR
ncbi:MAG: hypothetical protein HYR64_08920 [Fimbriimonas ginsengisoli]|uniref:PilZ domain-containing protein n=1 Tax=Fimbriimonas ginsengisoli TaxID=1005039 RepID=A0A931PV36_FIMGI|nr:hypothetical protein [Fimbriimonas ginsengisoli]